MLTYAERRQAYLDGLRSEREMVNDLFMDPPADLPPAVLAEMREMASTKGINACTCDVLADLIVATIA